MALPPTIRISVYWHPERKSWRILGEYCGRTTVVENYHPEMTGAPTPSDLRAMVRAICVEADSWLL